MKRGFLIMLIFSLSSALFAQDASTAWRDVLRRCAKTDLIGRQSLFFGMSNLIGPGSIWRRADDNSIRLVSVLSDAFPKDSDQAPIVKANNVAACVGNSTSRWNLHFGLPFSTGATPLSLNIGAILGGAHNVTVSVKGYAVDTLDEDQWKKAFSDLGPDNVFYKDSLEPNRLLAENSVKITGLTAVFNFSHDIAIDVQAQYKGKTFTLGNNSSSGTGNNNNTGSGTSGSSTTGSTPSTNSSSSTSGGSASSTSPCTSSGQTGSSSAPATNNAASGNSGNGSGVATFHIEFSGSRQITICSDGPFYILSAYSNLKNGAPIGIAPTQASIVLSDATLPPKAVAASDRQTSKPQQ